MTARARSNSLRRGTCGAALKMPNELGRTLAAYSGHDLAWRVGVVLVIDVVESVRMMAADQGRFITQWVYIRNRIRERDRRRGRCAGREVARGRHADRVQGRARRRDGVVCESRSRQGRQCGTVRRGADRTAAGLNVGEFLFDQRDIYGSSANLAARLCGLAEPHKSSSRAMSATGLRIRWMPTSTIWVPAT